MGKKILVVDDEEVIVEPLGEMLSRNGYEVLKAGDGKKGFEEAKKHQPDLILLDVNMPKMNGFQLLEHLKKERKTADIPVFMLTARNSAEDVSAGIAGYADKYIPKPFDFNHLLSEIQKTLTLR